MSYSPFDLNCNLLTFFLPLSQIKTAQDVLYATSSRPMPHDMRYLERSIFFGLFVIYLWFRDCFKALLFFCFLEGK